MGKHKKEEEKEQPYNVEYRNGQYFEKANVPSVKQVVPLEEPHSFKPKISVSKKRLVAVLVCFVVVALVFGAYSLGANVNGSYSDGFKDGQAFAASQMNTPKGPSASGTWVQGYDAGYLAGLQDAQKTLTP